MYILYNTIISLNVFHLLVLDTEDVEIQTLAEESRDVIIKEPTELEQGTT